MAPTVIEKKPSNIWMTVHPKLDKGLPKPNIIDIREDRRELSMHDEIMKGLQAGENKERTLPTVKLHDERGLQLFEAITYLDEYYPTNTEIEVLESWAGAIARHIRQDSIIVELGSGNLRKTCVLLDALEKLGRSCQFFALDLSLPELQRTLAVIPAYQHVAAFGLHGTYENGLEWLKRSENHTKPKCIMSLGSFLGNFSRPEASSFLRSFASILTPERDVLLVALDGCQDSSRVYKAYNDESGTTRQFILNGLAHVNRILGEDIFKPADWEYVGEYDKVKNCHQASYVPNRDIAYRNILIRAGERVLVEECHKYALSERADLWARSGLRECARWGPKSCDSSYFIHMLTPSHT